MDVDIVIRTLNESALLGRCLETLAAQRGDFRLNVVVVDSGSTDGTLEIAREHHARVIEMEPERFDYSTALNLGIETGDAEVIVILSAHAIPLDDRWLARMTAPFADVRVAGVASRQVPWPDAPWWEVRRLGQEFPEHSRVFTGDGQPLFSNASSCIRRSVWRQERFALPAAEDLAWARAVVANGQAIVYEAGAAVYHSHDESPRARARRMIDVNRVNAAASGGPSRRRAAREGSGLLLRNSRAILELDETPRRKAAHLGSLARMAFFYVVDYGREGSTAERRRAEAGPAPLAQRS